MARNRNCGTAEFFRLLSLGVIFLAAVAATAEDVIIDTDRTDTVKLGSRIGVVAGPGTATVLAGVTVQTIGGLSDYAMQVNEDTGTFPFDWTIDNLGNLTANDADSLHVQTTCAVNNSGSILSLSGIGIAAEFSAVDPGGMSMALTNNAGALVQGSGDGVWFDLGDNGNTGDIDNQGTIQGYYGVQVIGGATTVNNSGTIIGIGGEGVFLGDIFDFNDYTLINSGTIISDPSSLFTVSFGSGNDSATLQTGTQIINGGIDAGGGSDTLTLDGSGAVTWEAYYFENLNKTGNGLWTLEYDLNLAEDSGVGSTVIGAGELGLFAALTSDAVDVQAAGTLSGDGSIIGNISNDGSIAPGSASGGPFGILAVTGTASFGAGSTFLADIGAQSTGDLLDVSGTATLAGTIRVNEVTAIPDGGWVDVISAGVGVANSFGSLDQEASLIVTFAPLALSNSLRVVATRVPYSNFAATENQTAVAEALHASVGLSTDDLGRVLAYIDFLSEQNLQNAFEELQPKPYADHPDIILQQSALLGSVLADRLDERRSELAASADPATRPAASHELQAGRPEALNSVVIPGRDRGNQWFAQLLSAWREEKFSYTGGEYDTLSVGMVCGLDRLIGRHLIGGLGLATGVADIAWRAYARNGSQLYLRLGPYFSFFRGGLALDGAVAGGLSWFDTRRSIGIADLFRTAEGEYGAYDIAAQLSARYGFSLGGLRLSPQAGLGYDFLYLNQFQESQAESISLIVSDRRLHALNQQMGVRLDYRVDFGRSILLPEAWFNWIHEYLDAEREIQSSLVGAPDNDFTISTPAPPPDTLEMGGGLRLLLAQTLSGYLSYLAEFREGVWNQSVRGGILIRL